ncbi:MAG: hypothetical protein Q8Q09_17760 [Deltaproteobacteria bacterium]|nr:hypothetical protein [Deltaproteobacteria bacterium]
MNKLFVVLALAGLLGGCATTTSGFVAAQGPNSTGRAVATQGSTQSRGLDGANLAEANADRRNGGETRGIPTPQPVRDPSMVSYIPVPQPPIPMPDRGFGYSARPVDRR